MNVRSAAARLSVRMHAPTGSAKRPLPDLAARRRRDAQRRRLSVAGLRLLLGVVILGTWELTTRLGWVDVFFWSQPSAIAAKLWIWITQGTDLGPLWDQVLTTMEETVGGFVVGSILGVMFGVALGRSRLLSDVLGPYIKGANAIPRVVVGALFAVALGLDIRSKIATAAVLVFFVVFFNATQGLGELIYAAKNNFDTAGVFAGMALLAAMALVAEALITALENRLIKWRPPVATETRI